MVVSCCGTVVISLGGIDRFVDVLALLVGHLMEDVGHALWGFPQEFLVLKRVVGETMHPHPSAACAARGDGRRSSRFVPGEAAS